MKDRIALIEIAYAPATGKAGKVESAIDDAIDQLFMNLTIEGLVVAGHSTVRIVTDGRTGR